LAEAAEVRVSNARRVAMLFNCFIKISIRIIVVYKLDNYPLDDQ
jgi:hypothetical protein